MLFYWILTARFHRSDLDLRVDIETCTDFKVIFLTRAYANSEHYFVYCLRHALRKLIISPFTLSITHLGA